MHHSGLGIGSRTIHAIVWPCAPADGSAWLSGNCNICVLRGGSWSVSPWFLRAAFRVGLGTGNRYDGSGFRVARTLSR
ncbi:MAG: SUMF1/EgtB/PvdO family nonheme iron enzyme [Alphaproteobacteria bacterium]|nr:SUMF1/EgtB/PvdO family nonheme iron enzyme [Alphaproteobacteria bacterium]